MKKTHLIITLLLLLLTAAVLSVSVSAIGDSINAVGGTPVIDGTIEKLWYKADRTILPYAVGGDKPGKPGNKGSAFVSMLWDEEAIYFLIEIVDDDFVLNADPESGLNDTFYIMIDEADCFGPTWQKGQSLIALTPAAGMSRYAVEGDGPSSYEMSWNFEDESHCVIEFKYVPATLKLNASAEVLMDFRYEDRTPRGTLDCAYSWSDEIGEALDDSASWSYVNFRMSASAGKQSSGLKEAAAAIGRTPITSYKPVRGTDGNPNEDASKIWDLDTHTKFCTSTFPMESIVRLEEAMSIDGLLMATANDNESYHDRNPCGWEIDGSTDGHTWVKLVSGDDSFFKEVNYTYFGMTIEPTEPYRYFRFYNTGAYSGCCQISEVTLCSTPGLAPAPEEEEEIAAPVTHPENFESSALERIEPGSASAAAASGNAAPIRHFSDVPGIIAAAVAAVGLAASLVLMVRMRRRENEQ